MWILPEPGLALHRPVALLGGRASQAQALPLYGSAGARQLERWAAVSLPPHRLMQRAGLGVARLALAVAPGARRCWVAAGPGNNGGDGFEAAVHLQRLGWRVEIGFTGDAQRLPPDAAASLARAQAAGVPIEAGGLPPTDLCADDLVIDALLGRGLTRPVEGPMAAWITALNDLAAPVLAVDLPSGLPGDTGALPDDAACVRARWTLALLGLGPGLFTAQGRDFAGDIWWDDLAVPPPPPGVVAPCAWLEGGASVKRSRPARQHAQHKGSFGDVWVVAGAEHMAGAGVLAARAALRAGAGRVYLAPLTGHRALADTQHPELMLGQLDTLPDERLHQVTVVAGCGGGLAIGTALPRLLRLAGRLVLDADGLNAVATDPALQTLLAARPPGSSVLTPHPLEAARLLGLEASQVQSDRLSAASALATRHGATVVLKGSGTVVATPEDLPSLMPVGNAALATPGSGDVLAGWLGGTWCPWPAGVQGAARAARLAVWQHGMTAERLRPDGTPLPASELAEALDSAA